MEAKVKNPLGVDPRAGRPWEAAHNRWFGVNPFSTVWTAAGAPVLPTDLWIRRAVERIDREGAEQFLVDLLAAFSDTVATIGAEQILFPAPVEPGVEPPASAERNSGAREGRARESDMPYEGMEHVDLSQPEGVIRLVEAVVHPTGSRGAQMFPVWVSCMVGNLIPVAIRKELGESRIAWRCTNPHCIFEMK